MNFQKFLIHVEPTRVAYLFGINDVLPTNDVGCSRFHDSLLGYCQIAQVSFSQISQLDSCKFKNRVSRLTIAVNHCRNTRIRRIEHNKTEYMLPGK